VNLQHPAQLRRQLIDEGYCHLPGIAPAQLIEQTRQIADRMAQELPDELKQKHRFQGSLIDVCTHPGMAQLIALPSALEALRQLGFPQPKFYSGYIISKPPETAPALFWHQDGFGWNEPISYTNTPVQFFLMYYLIDTNRHNGCLRIIPGSHLKRHRLHDLPPAHTDEIQQADEGHPALQIDPDEVDVPVQAGDLVIGDARLLHAAHPNRSEQRRTVITLWFCPNYDQLPESIQAIYGKPRHKPDHWSDEIWNLVEPLVATYQGNAEAAEYNRIPDQRLA
jgi:hypothetical protein